MRTDEIAVPGIDDNSVRRSEFPTVYPNPGSRGSIVNLERMGEISFSEICGLATMNTCFLLQRGISHSYPAS
jgi:hypothetical protein